MDAYATYRSLDKMLFVNTSLKDAGVICDVHERTLKRHLDSDGVYDKGGFVVRRVEVVKIAGRGKGRKREF